MLKPFPIPRPPRSDARWQRAVALAVPLHAATDTRLLPQADAAAEPEARIQRKLAHASASIGVAAAPVQDAPASPHLFSETRAFLRFIAADAAWRATGVDGLLPACLRLAIEPAP